MKILHIAPIGHHSEGIGTVLMNLVKKEQALGHDVRVVSKYKNDVYTTLDISTITQKHEFDRFLKTWVPDVVMFHSLYEMEFLAFAKVLKARQIPYAIQMHGALSKENYKKSHIKKVVANFLWYNNYIKSARCIVYLNQGEYDNCVVKNLNSKHAILPNGCDEVSCIEIDKESNHPFEIIFIGRININHKGLDELVKAIRLLKSQKIKDIHFSFYGNDSDADVSKFKQMLIGLESIAQFCGGIYGEDKNKKLRNSDLFILTSRYEGMPMGVLEAISYGLPCLLTPGTNMSDVVAENGAGFKCNFEYKSIAQAILVARDLIQKSPKFYRHNAHCLSKTYSWNSIAKQSIEIFKSCIK